MNYDFYSLQFCEIGMTITVFNDIFYREESWAKGA